MNKARIDSVLLQLTEDQQAQVYDWLQTIGYERTKEKLALPPPDGFNVHTHLPSLRRFLVRYSAALRQRDPLDDLPASADTAQDIETAAQSAAFDLASNPSDPESFAHVSRWITKLKAHEVKTQYLDLAKQHLALAEKRLELDRERFELNAARLALKHFLKLEEIYETEDMNNEDKVRAARDHLFRSPPADQRDVQSEKHTSE